MVINGGASRIFHDYLNKFRTGFNIWINKFASVQDTNYDYEMGTTTQFVMNLYKKYEIYMIYVYLTCKQYTVFPINN